MKKNMHYLLIGSIPVFLTGVINLLPHFFINKFAFLSAPVGNVHKIGLGIFWALIILWSFKLFYNKKYRSGIYLLLGIPLSFILFGILIIYILGFQGELSIS